MGGAIDYKAWNVIFLVNDLPPARVLLLQRAANKAFAPGLYTGVGGKVEPGETPLASALRELEEETGITGLPLAEFARVQIRPDLWLHYFYAVWDGAAPSTEDGTLVWSDTGAIFERKIIPTTQRLLAEWARRGFGVERPFTMVMDEAQMVDGIRMVVVRDVKDGLAAA